MRNYLHLFLFCCACMLCLMTFLYTPNEDHIGAISLHNDTTWYMNFRRANSMQFQDRDVLYHRIGKSIKHAKKADIIILGHSMALFGLDWQMLNAFAKKNHVRIYNMASASDASGEFSLRIIEKYHIHPSIWIINADDHENNFFKVVLQNTDIGTAAYVVKYSRWQAFKNILSKNITWKTELLFRQIMPKKVIDVFYPNESIFNYRSITTGNWNNENWPGYSAKNDTFKNDREPNCHMAQDEALWATQYIKRLKQGDVILTLVPYIKSCRPRVKELANYLKVPFISIDWQGMTSVDHGGHLDSAGAKMFTSALLQQLEKNPDFKKLILKRSSVIKH